MKTKKNLSKPTRIGIAALAATSVIAAATGTADAGGYYSLHAWKDYSSAYTRTWSGMQGKSYARHGSRVASTGWTTYSSYAYADAGWSSSYYAAAYFR